MFRPGGVLRRAILSRRQGRDGSALTGRINGGSVERVASKLTPVSISERVFEYSGDALIVHDENGRFVEANGAACRLLGYTRDEFLSLSLLDIESDFDLFDIREHWDRMRYGDAVTVEGRPRHKDGHTARVEVRLSLLDASPGARLFLASLRDVRARQSTLQATAEFQARFRQLIEHAGDAFFLHDAEGRVIDTNHRACVELGYDRPQLVGQSMSLFDTTLSGSAPWVGIQPNETRNRESMFRRSDGLTYPAEIREACVEWEGKLLFLAFARDITARRIAEEERAEHIRRLAQSNADLQQYTAVASHDLREPLRKVAAFADLLIESCEAVLEPEAREFLDVIVRSVDRMQRLVDTLLTYAQAGAAGLTLEAVALGTLVAEVADDFVLRIQELGATLEIGPLPTVNGDPDQLRQLIQNLLGNALKYRDPARPPHVRVTGRLAEGWVTFEVTDNGIGFDPSFAERIFDPFARLHSRKAYEGAGIGLAICQRIVERHGGSIRAASGPGLGSTFTVRLPQTRRRTSPLPPLPAR